MNNFYWMGCDKKQPVRHGWDIVHLPTGDYVWMVR